MACDMNAIVSFAPYVVYLTAGFVFIPAGRDLIAPGKAILPGDDKLIDVMSAKPNAMVFVWGIWGTNFCTLSALKIIATMLIGTPEIASILLILFVGNVIGTVLLFKEKAKLAESGADVTPFCGLFALETLALAALVFAWPVGQGCGL